MGTTSSSDDAKRVVSMGTTCTIFFCSVLAFRFFASFLRFFSSLFRFLSSFRFFFAALSFLFFQPFPVASSFSRSLSFLVSSLSFVCFVLTKTSLNVFLSCVSSFPLLCCFLLFRCCCFCRCQAAPYPQGGGRCLPCVVVFVVSVLVQVAQVPPS